MKLSSPLFAAAALAAGMIPALGRAASCSGSVGHAQAVSLEGARTTVVNFPATPGDPNTVGPGRFDPTPLLETTVSVPAALKAVNGRLVPEVNCLIVHFSSESYLLDNGIVFQVLLDGVPMRGSSPSGPDSIPNPVVFQENPIIRALDGTEIGRPHGLTQMLHYTFFAAIPGGTHDVKLLFANCCSNADGAPGTTGDVVQAATLTVESK